MMALEPRMMSPSPLSCLREPARSTQPWSHLLTPPASCLRRTCSHQQVRNMLWKMDDLKIHPILALLLGSQNMFMQWWMEIHPVAKLLCTVSKCWGCQECYSSCYDAGMEQNTHWDTPLWCCLGTAFKCALLTEIHPNYKQNILGNSRI